MQKKFGAHSAPSYRDFVASLGEFASTWQGQAKSSALTVAWGESDYLLSRTASYISDLWSASGIAVVTVEGADLNPERFRELVCQTSLFDEQTFYIIRRAEKKADIGKLLALMSKKGRSSLLVLYGKGKLTADMRREIDRLEGHEIPCVEPNLQEINKFVAALAKKYHFDLTSEAVSLLLDHYGRDLAALENEIRKLSYIFPQRVEALTVSDVGPHIGFFREDEVFALDQLLLQRQWAKAQIFLESLLERGETPLAVLGLLARHCRIAIQVSEAANARGDTGLGTLAGRLRIPISVIKSYTSYVSKSKPSRFQAALVACAKADLALKSSGASERVVLSGVIAELS